MADRCLSIKFGINSLMVSENMHFTDDGCPHDIALLTDKQS